MKKRISTPASVTILVKDAFEHLRLERHPAIELAVEKFGYHIGPSAPRWNIDSTSSFMKPPTSMRLPSDTGPKVETRPDVPMPPRQPVASTSSTFAPSRAALTAAAVPAGPPPATSTSKLSSTGMSRLSWYVAMLKNLLRLNAGVRGDLAVAVHSVFQDGCKFGGRRGDDFETAVLQRLHNGWCLDRLHEFGVDALRERFRHLAGRNEAKPARRHGVAFHGLADGRNIWPCARAVVSMTPSTRTLLLSGGYKAWLSRAWRRARGFAPRVDRSLPDFPAIGYVRHVDARGDLEQLAGEMVCRVRGPSFQTTVCLGWLLRRQSVQRVLTGRAWIDNETDRQFESDASPESGH